MKKEQRERIFNRKKWVSALAVLLLFTLLFWNTETLKEEVDVGTKNRVYQIYCLGDSITYGSGLSEEERVTASYPAQLEQLLGARYAVVNYGVSGATLQDLPERGYRNTGYLDMVKMQSPDIVIVMLGTNDSKESHWDAKRYREQYMTLVKELQDIPSHPYVYLMTPPEAFPLEDGNIIYGIDNGVIQGEIRETVRAVAGETNAGLIDLYAVTENHPEYFVDGVHPNAAGYALLAETVAGRIRQDQEAGVYE